uniref:Uncharacterized protein n=1 Tax=Quercus lobata TaxID=97700 RepID=A0A7N2LKJ4_QUELO
MFWLSSLLKRWQTGDNWIFPGILIPCTIRLQAKGSMLVSIAIGFLDGGKEEKKKDPTSSSVKCFFIRKESIGMIYEARSLFMHAHRLPSVANYMARFSLILSKTTKLEVDLASVNIQRIEDVLCTV